MTIYHRPSGATRFFNSVFGWLASRGLTPRSMVSLEVKGRRSGQPRTTVVNWVEHRGERYFVSPRGEAEWVRNVRAAGCEAVIRHGSRTKVRLEEMPSSETAPIIQAYLKRNAMATKAHFGVERNAPLQEFERIAPDHPVFRIVVL